MSMKPISICIKKGGDIMEHSFNGITIEPYLYTSGGIITEVNNEFIDLTGFAMDELIGKSLIEIGDMLKINSQICLDEMDCNYSGFIFTKLLEVREVNISLSRGRGTNEKVYFFVEKPNSRLKDKLIFVKQTFIDNISGAAVYSVPDLVLLKANQRYLDFLDSPFNKEENSLGKHIREIVTGYLGSQVEDIWKTALKTQKTSYTKEFRFDKFERGITYWDSIQTPIFENGKMKYLFDTATEVTERVLKNKSIELQNNIIKQQKEQLEEQNSQLMSIIENLSEGVVLTDNKGNFIMANTEARRLIYQSDEVIALGGERKNAKYFDMEGNEIPFENMPGIRALRGESVKNAKMFVSNPDKEYFIDNSSIPIYNTNGDLTMVVLCSHDITDTIKQSKKIEEQKKELEAIIENITDGITIIDNKGRYIISNRSAREMFSSYYGHVYKVGDGYKQSEFYDVDGEKIDLENIPARRIMRGEKFKNMRIAIKFPHKTLQVDVSGTPIYDSKGEFALGVFCSRDMTDYFKHEEAIRSRNELLNRIIDTFDFPVVRLSCPDLKIVDINKKAYSITKSLKPNIKSMRQLIGNKIEDLFEISKESDYNKCISEVLSKKKTAYLNGKKHSVSGEEFYWNVIFEPILRVNGEIQEILILMIDVTTEIKSKIDVEKAMKSQEEVFANISHELKTPLNVIFATAQLLNMYSNNGSLDERKNSIIRYINSIKQNSYRLSRLINNIVDLSKIEAGFFKLNLSNNNIVEVVEEIVMSVTNYTEINGINIIFDTDTEEKIIACDPQMIERIVLNLISNAIKFSEVGDEIFVDIKDKDEYIEISVKDNGIGIEANDLNMIFDRFKQVDKSLSRNAEGTGIGLSLVKSIVELHGGSIYVESKLGEGSKFTVVLPAQKVMQENMIFSSKLRNKSESIQVELSDICT